MHKKLFVLILLATALVGSRVSAQTTATATWRVQSYDVNVTLPADEKARAANIHAVVVVKNVSSGPAGTLTFRISTAADVSAVQINGSTADFGKSEEKINAAL